MTDTFKPDFKPDQSRRERIAQVMLMYLDHLPITAEKLTEYAMEANEVQDVPTLVPEYRREVDDLLRCWRELGRIAETDTGWIRA